MLKQSDSPTGSGSWAAEALPHGDEKGRERLTEGGRSKKVKAHKVIWPPQSEIDEKSTLRGMQCELRYLFWPAHGRLTLRMADHGNWFEGLQNCTGTMVEAHPLGEWLERLSWDQASLHPVKYYLSLNPTSVPPLWVLSYLNHILHQTKSSQHGC